jgi:predicted nucleic acid-binding protein
MTAAETFFDTNVLLYLVSSDARKADVAESVLAAGGHVSVQVLNEFASVARRKAGLAWSEIGELLDHVRQVCTVHPLTLDVHEAARGLAARYRLAFYDALIVASAMEAGCRVLLSEDLQMGQRFAGAVTVRDPFAEP